MEGRIKILNKLFMSLRELFNLITVSFFISPITFGAIDFK